MQLFVTSRVVDLVEVYDITELVFEITLFQLYFYKFQGILAYFLVRTNKVRAKDLHFLIGFFNLLQLK